MGTETLCIEEAIEVVESSLGRLDKVCSAEADALAAAKLEPTSVDCAGLCEE